MSIRVYTNGIINDNTVGYSNFLQILSKHLVKHDIYLSRGYDDNCDVYILNNLDDGLYSINSKCKYILRMDGFGHDFNAVDKAKFLFKGVNHIIYQSKFAKEFSDRLIGKYDYKSTVIYNGVEILDLNIPIHNSNPVKIGSIIRVWIKERAENFINFLIALRHFQQNYKIKVQYYIIGDTSKWQFKDIVIGHFSDLDIIFTGLLPRNEVNKIREELDFVVHLPKYGWCDNSVIETLNHSLPILYLNGNATQELVENAGVGIEDINKIQEIVDKLKILYDNILEYNSNAFNRRYLFDINKIAEQYAKVIKSVLYEKTYISNILVL